MYFLRPFNMDPENPWSVASPSNSPRQFSARWVGVGLLVMGVLFAAYSVYQDYSFMPGSAYTEGTFVKVTGSQAAYPLNSMRHTNYFGQYRYSVSGRTYFISQTEDEPLDQQPQFDQTINIAYKVASPAKATIVYGGTLPIDARGSIADGLGIGIGGYCLIYLICAPIAAFQTRKRRKVDGQILSTSQIDADAQSAIKELQAREAAQASAPVDSSQPPTGTPSV